MTMKEASNTAESIFTDLDGRLAAMPIPLSLLTEITGISPDFYAVQSALDITGEMPLAYADLYASALRTIATTRLAARREALMCGETFAPEAWLGNLSVKDQLAEQIEPEARRLSIINNLSNFFASEIPLPWRDYQRETILKTLRFLVSGKDEIIRIPELSVGDLQRYGYNDEPTGSGKTVAMALTALGMGVGLPVGSHYANKIRGAVIGPTLNTINQTLGDYVRGFSKFAPSIKIERLDHYHHELAEDWSMLAATYKMALNMLRSGDLQSFDLDVLFLDEGHHALGTNFRKALATSNIPIVIGFTATPNYNEERQLSHILPNLILKVDQAELIERGDLSGLHILEVCTGEDFEISGYTPSGGFLEEDLEVLLLNDKRNQKIRDTAAGFVEAGIPIAISMIPGGNCHHARYMADELSKLMVTVNGATRPIVAKAIGDFKKENGKRMTDTEKQQILDDFEAGKIDVLTYVDYLDEAWDTTRLCALIITDPTTSERKERQRVGRLSRLLEGQPVKWVIEFIDKMISEKQVLAVDLFNDRGVEAEFVVGTAQTKEFVAKNRPLFRWSGDEQNRRERNELRHGEVFPFLPKDVEQSLDLARLVLVAQRRIEAVKQSEMPPEGWPSFGALRRERPEMSEKALIAAIRSQPDLYKSRTRARSVKGNNQLWEIYYPPDTKRFIAEYKRAEVASLDREVPIFRAGSMTGYDHRRVRACDKFTLGSG